MTRTPGKRKRKKAREWWIMMDDDGFAFGGIWPTRRAALRAASDFYPIQKVRAHVLMLREVVKK